MNINGFAHDAFQGLYFFAGRIELARKTGKASWAKVNEIFDVSWCEVDDAGACIERTITELSVFNDVFESYFWDVLNWKTRLVQFRLYPVKDTQ